MVILIRVKTFIEEAKSGSIDLDDFIKKVVESSHSIQEKYSPFITINDSPSPGKGSLQYLPVSIKDNICTKGIKSTAGSKILETYVPTFDATVVKKVKEAGGMIIGKTAQDEFGFGTFSTNCAYGVPKNPYDTSRTCGGSSGGASCLTAAADFPHIAIAESTGGSITAPAAFTGTVGLTPTYGRVSRFGLIDYSNSMDKIGVISREVYDSALMLSIISGHDPLDSTSSTKESEDFMRYIEHDVKGFRLGVPREYFEGVDVSVEKLVWERLKALESEGVELVEISLPSTKYAIAAYYIIAMSEASTNLARYCGMRYGMQEEVDGDFSEYFSKVRSKYFGEEAKRRIILGTYMRAAGFRDAYYIKALKVRKLIIDEFKKAFAQLDAIATPSMPMLPPRFDEIEKLTPIEIYNMDKMTTAPNLCGFPTISVPAGFSKGLPAGMQIIGNHFEEGKIISIASKAEMIK